jgi:hypothetical protein
MIRTLWGWGVHFVHLLQGWSGLWSGLWAVDKLYSSSSKCTGVLDGVRFMFAYMRVWGICTLVHCVHRIWFSACRGVHTPTCYTRVVSKIERTQTPGPISTQLDPQTPQIILFSSIQDPWWRHRRLLYYRPP